MKNYVRKTDVLQTPRISKEELDSLGEEGRAERKRLKRKAKYLKLKAKKQVNQEKSKISDQGRTKKKNRNKHDICSKCHKIMRRDKLKIH
jgi:hypothetical protein